MLRWIILCTLLAVCLGTHIKMRPVPGRKPNDVNDATAQNKMRPIPGRKPGPIHKPGRIVGGDPIDIKDAPYQVVLLESGSFICGGSIVAKDIILTAGHCVDAPASRLSVRAGTTKYSSGGSVHKAVKVLRHPQYDQYTIDYDIAVISIDPPIELDETRQIIYITSTEPVKGENITVSGWGTTTEDSGVSSTLRSVSIPAISREDCQDMYSVEEVTPRMFCAGRAGHDHCYGDSGGPLVREVQGIVQQVGTVSWAYGCARDGYPGVNGNLANDELRTWLLEHAGV